MGIYGDLQKLNQAQKTSASQAELPMAVSAVSAMPAAEPAPTSLSEVQSQPVILKTNVPASSQAKKSRQAIKSPRHRDTTTPSHHDTKLPRYRDTTIETIRAAVRVFGKEAATHRFTPEEKRAIRDIVYAYEGQGVRTSETEIVRIGVNFLIEDYQQNGENSLLHQVMTALKA